MTKHCMDCGDKLEEVNYVTTSTKYHCFRCDSDWFKTTKTIVEWTRQRSKEQ